MRDKKSTFDVLCVFSYDDRCNFALEKCIKIGEELLLKEEIDESNLAAINRETVDFHANF